MLAKFMNTPKKHVIVFAISPLQWESFSGTSEKSVATYTHLERYIQRPH